MDNIRIERQYIDSRVRRLLENENLTDDASRLQVGDIEVKPIRVVAERTVQKPVKPTVGMTWVGSNGNAQARLVVVCVNPNVVYYTVQRIDIPNDVPAVFAVDPGDMMRLWNYPTETVKEKYWKDL